MKKKQVWKVISLLLSVILLFSSVPISAISLEISDAITNELETPSAVSESGGESVAVKETPKTIDLHVGEKSIAELQAMKVDLNALPEAIDQAVALKKGHVNRLIAQEEGLSTVIYQNIDGTKSTYLFSTPVKYVDESGAVRDKSSKVTPITDTLYSHAMLNNSTKVYFPKSAANGTKVSFGDYSITMSPKTSTLASATQMSDRNMVYANVFGKGTALAYSTEMNGLKEDIVLDFNVGKNSFDFVLVATNVTPVQIDGVWCFLNAADTVVARLGSIDVRDSAGNTTTGTLTLTSTEVAGKYDVTVSVDESFLNASTTIYPVYIDPTVYIFEEENYWAPDGWDYPYTAILDTGIYDTEAAKNVALSDPYYHSLGTGKIIYKFPGFYDTYTEDGAEYHYSTLYNLNETQIGTATLYFLESDGLDLSIAARPMIDTWDEATVGENPVALYDLDLFTAYSTSITCWEELDYVAGMEYRELDVTRIFREWARYNEFERINSGESNPYLNPANGFALMSETSEYCEIAATETVGTSAVYIVLDTSTISEISLIMHPQSGRYLSVNNTFSLVMAENLSNPNLVYHWKFDYLGNNCYYIRLETNPNYILVLGANGCSIAQVPNGVLTAATCQIETTSTPAELLIRNYNGTRTLYSDGSEAKVYTNGALNPPDYQQTLWRRVSQSSYEDAPSFEIDVPNDIQWLPVGEALDLDIVLSSSNATFTAPSYFIWESNNENVATVDGNGNVSTLSNGAVGITVTHKITRQEITVCFTVGQLISNGVYSIKNARTKRYVEIRNQSLLDGASIQQYKYHTGEYMRWQFIYDGCGYYYIKSVYSNAYLTMDSNHLVIQKKQLSDAGKWYIEMTSSGNYKILFESSKSDLALSIMNSLSTDGTRVRCSSYSNDDLYDDEWLVFQYLYEYSINHYYDYGFVVRYGMFNDDTDVETAEVKAKENIVSYQNEVAELLLQTYNIGIQATYGRFTSSADNCKGTVTESNLALSCAHSPNHLTSDTLRGDLSDGNQTTTIVIWTGHILTNNERSNSSSDKHSIVMTPCHTTDPNNGYANLSLMIIPASYKSDLAHEISHQLGAKDHYCLNNDGTQCSNPDCDVCVYHMLEARECMMSRRGLAISSIVDAYCETCKNKIRAHLEDHHILS